MFASKQSSTKKQGRHQIGARLAELPIASSFGLGVQFTRGQPSCTTTPSIVPLHFTLSSTVPITEIVLSPVHTHTLFYTSTYISFLAHVSERANLQVKHGCQVVRWLMVENERARHCAVLMAYLSLCSHRIVDLDFCVGGLCRCAYPTILPQASSATTSPPASFDSAQSAKERPRAIGKERKVEGRHTPTGHLSHPSEIPCISRRTTVRSHPSAVSARPVHAAPPKQIRMSR